MGTFGWWWWYLCLMTTEIDRHLPLKPLPLNILLALGERAHHGYSLMRTLKEDERFTAPVHTGPLYRTVKLLLEAGLVAELAAPPDGEEGDARRGSYYELSPLGRKVLAAELGRLASVVEIGNALAGLSRLAHLDLRFFSSH